MMRRSVYSFLFFLCWAFPQKIQSQTLPAGFAQIKIADGLNPTALAGANDGRVFFTEKDGRVRVVQNSVLLAEPVLEIPVESINERGLDGIALDPNFVQNGFLYLYYSPLGQHRNRISRFTVQNNVAAPSSEKILLDLDVSTNDFHNGGAMLFGNDGYLYVSTGDGGKPDVPQQLNSFLGKVLRIAPDGSIPPDNPFVLQADGLYRAIYALGFRNPFSMTKRASDGQIFLGDVGSDHWEELNTLTDAVNYGWPILEGKATTQTPPPNYRDPVYAYAHWPGCAITGITFYDPNNPTFPDIYRNRLFFTDYCAGFIRLFNPATQVLEGNFALGLHRPMGLLVAQTGDLYYLSRGPLSDGSVSDNTASENGALWRIFYTGSDKPYIFEHPTTPLAVAGETVELNTSATGKEPLYYIWYKNGQALPGALFQKLSYPTTLADSGAVFQCIVQNSAGRDTSLPFILRVTSNQRPNISIQAPATYAGGDTLRFSGQAFDPETGLLDSSYLHWKVTFHHDSHLHPALEPFSGRASGAYVVPRDAETATHVHYRITCSATDSVGLRQASFVDVEPELTFTEIQSTPPGMFIKANSQLDTTPFLHENVAGVWQKMTAQRAQIRGDSIWVFSHWNGGDTSTVLKFIASPTILPQTAHYESRAMGAGSGLFGQYFQENIPANFQNPVMERIDSTIDFNWGLQSPDPNLLLPDNFVVRWKGFIEPLFSEIHRFYLNSDDGSRLWVNHQLLVDQWQPQGPTEKHADIYLQAGKTYPIQIDYFESGGGSELRLSWSSLHLEKTLVPKSQLFPSNNHLPGKVTGHAWLDTNRNGKIDTGESGIEGVAVFANLQWPDVQTLKTETDSSGRFVFPSLPIGFYNLEVFLPPGFQSLRALNTIDYHGLSDSFQISSLDSLYFALPFAPSGNAFFTQNGQGLRLKALSPVPAHETLTAEFDAENEGEAILKIFDLHGKTVLFQPLSIVQGRNQVILPVQTLSAGLYQLSIQTKNAFCSGWWLKIR